MSSGPPAATRAGSAPPSFDGPCLLLDWRASARKGMSVDLRLGLPGGDGGHPFRGVQAGEEDGQRSRLRVTLNPEPPGEPPLYDGETMLADWNEGARAGMTARFVLDDGPDGPCSHAPGRHPFYGLAFGRSGGEPLLATAWAISESERVIPASAVRRRTPFDQLTEVTQSQILCRDPRFQRFVAERLHRLVPDPLARAALPPPDAAPPDEVAAAAVKAFLAVPSRSVMNRPGDAADRARRDWHRLRDAYQDEVWGRR